MKQLLIAFIASLFLLLVSCGGNDDSLEGKKAQLSKLKAEAGEIESQILQLENELQKLDPSLAEGPKGKLISTLPIEQGTFAHYFEVQGNAESQENISVSTDMGGLITKVYVTEGQKVSAGQTLVQLDNSVLLNNIEELKTSLGLAEIVFQKQEKLWDQNIGSEIQFLQAKNNKETLERKLQTTYSQLEKMQVKAPISGTVDEVFAKLGEMASPGRAVVRVVKLGVLKIEAAVPENYIGTINKGDKVNVNFPAIGLTREGTVKAVGQVVNTINRTFTVILNIDNKDEAIKPNLLAEVLVEDYTVEKAVIIPTRLIQTTRNTDYVFIVAKNAEGEAVAKKKVIQKGKSYEGKTEILEGLLASEVIIDGGYRDVTDGDLVRMAK